MFIIICDTVKVQELYHQWATKKEKEREREKRGLCKGVRILTFSYGKLK